MPLNDQAQAPKRNLMIDALKGYAIVWVVLGHIITFANPDYKYDTLFLVAYSFHMPMFMFLSGYLVWGRLKGDTFGWVWKKFKALGIPYLVWCFIGALAVAGLKLFSYSKFLKFIESTVMYYDDVWFLPVLFLCFCALVLYVYLEKHLGDYALILSLCGIAALYVLVPNGKEFGFSQVRWYFPFVLAGYLAASHGAWIQAKARLLVPSGVAAYPVLLSLWRWQENPAFYPFMADAFDKLAAALRFVPAGITDLAAKGVTLVYSYALPLVGIASSYFIMTRLKGLKLYSIFYIMGAFTLEIYLLHGLIVTLYGVTRVWLWFGDGYMRVASGTIILLILSLASIAAIGRSKTLYKALFGGRINPELIPEISKVAVLLVLVLAWLAVIQKALTI